MGDEPSRDWRVRLEEWRARRRAKAIERALHGTRGRASDGLAGLNTGHPEAPHDGAHGGPGIGPPS